MIINDRLAYPAVFVFIFGSPTLLIGALLICFLAEHGALVELSAMQVDHAGAGLGARPPSDIVFVTTIVSDHGILRVCKSSPAQVIIGTVSRLQKKSYDVDCKTKMLLILYWIPSTPSTDLRLDLPVCIRFCLRSTNPC